MMKKILIILVSVFSIYADVSTIFLENGLLKDFDKFEKWSQYSKNFTIHSTVTIILSKKIKHHSGTYIKFIYPNVFNTSTVKILFDNNIVVIYKSIKTNKQVKIRNKDLKTFRNNTINSIRIDDSDYDLDVTTKNEMKRIFKLFSTL